MDTCLNGYANCYLLVILICLHVILATNFWCSPMANNLFDILHRFALSQEQVVLFFLL